MAWQQKRMVSDMATQENDAKKGEGSNAFSLNNTLVVPVRKGII
jgi:hypothetical protein